MSFCLGHPLHYTSTTVGQEQTHSKYFSKYTSLSTVNFPSFQAIELWPSGRCTWLDDFKGQKGQIRRRLHCTALSNFLSFSVFYFPFRLSTEADWKGKWRETIFGASHRAERPSVAAAFGGGRGQSRRQNKRDSRNLSKIEADQPQDLLL